MSHRSPLISANTRTKNLAQQVKNRELDLKLKQLVGKGNFAIGLSDNRWASVHQRNLSHSTLKELPEVRISPPRLEKLPALKPYTRKFEEKIRETVPKGQ